MTQIFYSAQNTCAGKNKLTPQTIILFLVLILSLFGCSSQARPEPQFQVIAEGKSFDNALSITQLPLSFQGMVFENHKEYQKFLQQRASLRLYGMASVWESDYQTTLEQIDFQKYAVIMVIQEGIINTDSTIKTIRVREVKVVDNTLEVRVTIPEPTTPPCEEQNFISRLLGGQVCKPMGIYTNTFQMITVPRSLIPGQELAVVFIDESEKTLSKNNRQE